MRSKFGFFTLRGDLHKEMRTAVQICGFLGLILSWYIVAMLRIFPPSILPLPTKVIGSWIELFQSQNFLHHILYSLTINMSGCFLAIVVALPLGFVIGLTPLFRELTARQLAAVRYLPLPMLIGIFIKMFGIESLMKIMFLACSIFVYLVPAVASRVKEVSQVYVDTVRTLGAGAWKTIRYVFVPGVLSTVTEDIINLLAISWTYITIVEVINLSDGGVGAVSTLQARSGRSDMVYAAVITIMGIGYAIDKIGLFLDRLMWKYKYTGGK